MHYTDGKLFRVRLSDKQVTEVDLGGYRLISGDGMVLTDDNVLYVVRPSGSLVAKLRLNAGTPRSAAFGDHRPDLPRSDDGGDRRDRLLVVNSQFTGTALRLRRGRCSSLPLP